MVKRQQAKIQEYAIYQKFMERVLEVSPEVLEQVTTEHYLICSLNLV